MTDRTGIANAWLDGETPEAVIERDEAERAAREFEEAILPDGSLLFDRDPDTGAVEKMRFDDLAGTFTIERVVDVEPVIDWCTGRFNETTARQFGEFHHIARLAPEALDLWPLKHFGPNHGLPPQWYLQKQYHALVMKAAHDPDMSKFRCAPGNFIRRGDAA